jgi:hypothetical protein
MLCVGDIEGVGKMGTDPDPPVETACSGDDIAVGIEGNEGDFIDNLSVRCQPKKLSGPIYPAVGFGGAGGSFDGPYDCPAGQALTGLTGTVTEDQVYVRNVVIQCAPRADTTTTIEVKTPGKAIKVTGSVAPNQAGNKMTITLFEKKGGGFDKVDRNKPRLDASSEYKTTFDSPDAKKCKVTAEFPGTVAAEPSEESSTFSC